ncbi:MAG: hypothetical protein JRG71_06780 [Deltaproteobacteria bacterium]|nr:hypothetical protein [Deltaproteobacteria bacterium]
MCCTDDNHHGSDHCSGDASSAFANGGGDGFRAVLHSRDDALGVVFSPNDGLGVVPAGK